MLLITLLLVTGTALKAQKYAVSGYIVDKETGETVIGANVLIKGTHEGSSTDLNGYFQISGLTPDTYTLHISHLNYEIREISVNLENSGKVLKETVLIPRSIELDEVSVVEIKPDVFTDIESEVAHRQLSAKAIRSIPTSNNDVFKALKYLPGISSADPISPLYSARGGEPGGNKILLDGVTIYNPYHFVNVSGIFNLYSVKNIDLLVGGFGAEYGGSTSSVLNITTREGNNQKLHGEFKPTITYTNGVVDFPVGENSTMMVSGRFYYDLPSRFIIYSPSYFYDFNVSYNLKINRKNRLRLKYFYSKDNYDFSFSRFSFYYQSIFSRAGLQENFFDNYDVDYRNIWNNQAGTAILKSIISPRVFLTAQVYGSFFSSDNLSRLNFLFDIEDSEEDVQIKYETHFMNKIQDLTGKSTLNIDLSRHNSLKLGAEYSSYLFNNHILINQFDEGNNTRKPGLFSGFIEDEINYNKMVIRPGVRTTRFSYNNKWYYEPRINMSLGLPLRMKLKAAWGKYRQYVISINSQQYEISQFVDYYYPLNDMTPSTSTHYIFGLEKKFFSSMEVLLDFYYKDISQTYTFDFNLSEAEALSFTNKLVSGNGEAYGMELLCRGSWEKFSGWLSYGLSRATRSYPHIMNGKRHLFDYDRTHSFKTILNYQATPHLSYSGTFRLISGVPTTMENGTKMYYYYQASNNSLNFYPTYVTESKNNARKPMFLRLDLGMEKKLREGFGAKLSDFINAKGSYLSFELRNLLFFRRNVWFYFPLKINDRYFGFGTNYLPSVSVGYNIKF